MLGPGILWATIAIGETHLALLPYAGALFGMNILWIVLLVHVLYYPNFEFGPRYAVATGDSLIDGYGRMKLGKIFYCFFLAMMFVTPPLMMASLVGLTGSALYAGIPGIGYDIWCTAACVVTLAVIVSRKYKVIERIAKLLTLMIVMIALFAFLTSPPSLSESVSGLIPNLSVSATFMLVLVAVLRMPTDPTVSIFLSKWAQEKRREWGEDKHVLLSSLNKSLTDIRTGFVISFGVAVVFLSLGAVVLKPLGIVPQGIDISIKLSEIYTSSFGRWAYPVFIIAALTAFWGTYLSAMDGIFRLFTNIIERIFKTDEKKLKMISTFYTILVALIGLMMATFIKRPVALVLLAVSMGLLYYPIIFGMNIYCVTKLIDKEFRPGKLNLAVAFLGLILGITALILLILVRVVKIFD